MEIKIWVESIKESFKVWLYLQYGMDDGNDMGRLRGMKGTQEKHRGDSGQVVYRGLWGSVYDRHCTSCAFF